MRTYNPDGVNGELYLRGELLCYTIELPWLKNKRNCSCIPEGRYFLKKRWSPKHKWHLEVTGVKNRSLILIHPANDARKELRGCIAPVTKLTGAGKGWNSRKACEKVTVTVLGVIDREPVCLMIQNKAD